MTLRKFDDLENESDARYEKLITARSRTKIAERFDTTKPNFYPGDEALQFLKEKVDDIVDETNALRTASGSFSTRVTANDAKATNTATNLTATANGTSLTINSSDGSNVSIPAATTSAWGAMTDNLVTALNANTAKVGLNVTSGFSLQFTVTATEEGTPQRLQIRVTNDEVEDAEATSVTLNLS